MRIVQVLSWLASASFVLVGVLAVAAAIRQRTRAQTSLGAGLGLLVLVSVCQRVNELSGYDLRLLYDASVVAFAAAGYFLFDYRTTILPIPPPVRALVIATLAAATAFATAVRVPVDPTVTPTQLQLAGMSALVLVWSAVVIEPAIRFWWSSRRYPPIQRARLRLLSYGYMGIIGVLVVAGGVNSLVRDHLAAQLTIQVFVLLLVPVMYGAVLPPAWLRRRWLREAGERFSRSLVPVGTWHWDMTTMSVFWSEHLLRMHGLEATGFTPTFENSIDHVHPDDQGLMRDRISWALRSREPVALDHRIVLPDGEVRWHHLRADVVPDPATGRVLAVYGTAQDITERKRAEEALQASQAQLAEAQRIAHLGSWRWDLVTNHVDLSEELHEIYGVQPGTFDTTFESLYRAVHPDDRRLAEDFIRRALNEEIPSEAEFRVLRADGQKRWVHVRGHVVTGARGEAVALMGTALDVTDRKRVEEALRRSEERFRTLVESAPDGILVVDAAGRIVLANQESEQLFGYTRDELIGAEVDILVPDVFHGVHTEHRYRYMGQPRRRPMAAGRELTARHKDGHQVAVDISLSPLETDEGMLVVALVRDVADRRRAEQALQASQVQLAEAQKLAHIGSWTWHVASHQVTWSEEMYRLLGVSRTEEITFERFMRIVHPDERERVEAFIARVLTEGQPFSIEYRVRRPDGVERWVQGRGRVALDDDGEVATLHGTIQDITERMQAEEMLRASEERYRNIVETAQEGIWVIDAENRTTFVNAKMADTLGYTVEELLGLPLRALMDDEGWRLAAVYSGRRRSGAREQHEFRLRRKDGRDVWCLMATSPLLDEQGRYVGALAMVTDITARKLAEDTLRDAFLREREAAERLRMLDETKDALLMAVSHELRTPLSIVLGLSQTLQREEIRSSPDKLLELLVRLAANARRLDRLLMDLLDLDRLNRGIIEPRRRPTEVRDLALRVVDALEVRDHDIVVDVPRITAAVDPAQTERLLENLVANAAKHTPAGTRIWVNARAEPDGLLLVVEDEGQGVPDHLKSMIFEPFQQGEAPAHAPGTGIGLALVSRFAVLHGGRAWVEDRTGGGASFRVLLPTFDPHRPSEAAVPPSAAAAS